MTLTVMTPHCLDRGCPPMKFDPTPDGGVRFYHAMPDGTDRTFTMSDLLLKELDEGAYIRQVSLRAGIYHRMIDRVWPNGFALDANR